MAGDRISLSEACTLITRGITPSYVEKDGVIVINQRCIRNQSIQWGNIRFHNSNKKAVSAEKLLKEGDVLVNSTGVGTLGRVAQFFGLDNAATVDSHVTILRPNTELINSKYFGFCIRGLEKYIETLGEGSTGQTELSRDKLKTLEIYFPSPLEQKAIADVLSALDDKIELNRRMNETLEGIARTLFKDWFIDFGPVKAKAAGQQPPGLDADIVALFPDNLDKDGLPVGWKTSPFSDLIELIGGGTPKTSISEYWNGEIPWFSVVDAPSLTDIFVIDTEKKITQKGLDNSSARLLPVGTTIITARGTVGKLALVGEPMAMNQSCYGVKSSIGNYPYFNYFLMRSLVSELQNRTHGSVFDTITRDTFKSVNTTKPPEGVVAIFEELSTPCMETIKKNLEQSKTLSGMRDSLLPKLISGEIRVQDAEAQLEEVS